jgi:hypothetical protein
MLALTTTCPLSPFVQAKVTTTPVAAAATQSDESVLPSGDVRPDRLQKVPTSVSCQRLETLE